MEAAINPKKKRIKINQLLFSKTTCKLVIKEEIFSKQLKQSL
jgi:hypothetical protein